MLVKIASGDYSWHSFMDFAMKSITMHLVLGHDKQVDISDSRVSITPKHKRMLKHTKSKTKAKFIFSTNTKHSIKSGIFLHFLDRKKGTSSNMHNFQK